MRIRAFAFAVTLLLGITAPVAPPAFACGGVNHQAETPPVNKVVFYWAERLPTRCLGGWKDPSTVVLTQTMSLAEAKENLKRMKEEARTKEYFENHGQWFEYYQEGKWHAFGYYGEGEAPFFYK